jgi:sodium/proline symporter
MSPDQDYLFVTFTIYLLLMLGIGIVAWTRTNDLSDYILGGRKLGYWTTALSAGASDMSAWLLLGLPGYAYVAGYEAIWIAVGLMLGTTLNWFLVAPGLRQQSETMGNALTIPEFLENRFQDKTHTIRTISALFILFFFIFYISSGLIAGGKLFESVFNLSYHWAVITGTVAILIYTTLGGFLAVSWTDLFQGLLMSLALVITALYALDMSGGWQATQSAMTMHNTALTDLFLRSDNQSLGNVGIISLLGWGLGYFGQPHILARFMAIRSHTMIPSARNIALVWTSVGLICALLIGFCGIALAEINLTGPDSEKVFIEIVQLLFHPIPSGICLAAILAAIMSTADSQLLVASTAFTEDLYQALFKKQASQARLIAIGRMMVICIALLACLMALHQEETVLGMVAYAWAGFGAAFGPAILLCLFWKKLKLAGAIGGIITGATTVILWHQLDGGIFTLYELVPAFFLSTIICITLSLGRS